MLGHSDISIINEYMYFYKGIMEMKPLKKVVRTSFFFKFLLFWFLGILQININIK